MRIFRDFCVRDYLNKKKGNLYHTKIKYMLNFLAYVFNTLLQQRHESDTLLCIVATKIHPESDVFVYAKGLNKEKKRKTTFVQKYAFMNSLTSRKF